MRRRTTFYLSAQNGSGFEEALFLERVLGIIAVRRPGLERPLSAFPVILPMALTEGGRALGGAGPRRRGAALPVLPDASRPPAAVRPGGAPHP
eukprot:SAG11_NODE_3877_length_2175_cov_1.701349_1_plen_92_part_10